MSEHRWTLHCAGQWVAGGSCPDYDRAASEGFRYALQYASEGTCKLAIKEVKPPTARQPKDSRP